MADKTFRLEVVSPDTTLYSGKATFVIAQTTVGEIGIMANHEPMLGDLAQGGRVAFTQEDGTREAFAVQGGFLSVTGKTVIVLAESAQRISEIDEAAARRVLESADASSAEYQLAQSHIRAVSSVR